jgi:hypothetical protein
LALPFRCSSAGKYSVHANVEMPLPISFLSEPHHDNANVLTSALHGLTLAQPLGY